MGTPSTCPICDESVVVPFGPKDSPYLIVRSEVNDKEPHTRPFNDRSGSLLKTEMYEAGLNLLDFRQAVLWNHKLTEDGCDEFCEFNLYQELKNKKVVVLVGAGAVSHFTNGQYKVDDVKGLDITDEVVVGTEFLPFDCYVLALESPGTAFVKGVGELRFGLTKLVELIDSLKTN